MPFHLLLGSFPLSSCHSSVERPHFPLVVTWSAQEQSEEGCRRHESQQNPRILGEAPPVTAFAFSPGAGPDKSSPGASSLGLSMGSFGHLSRPLKRRSSLNKTNKKCAGESRE
ncbi:unnamed protein product [Symbiodinium microadriaticum]|nr:unnamed protein product [Symbiodinium microadriaticum]